MPTPMFAIRLPAALVKLLDAECDRVGKSRTEYVRELLEAQLMPENIEPPVTIRAPQAKPKPRATLPPVVRGSDLPDAPKAAPVAETGKGRGAAAMANSGVYVWNGEKRPIYQKGQTGQGKAKGRR